MMMNIKSSFIHHLIFCIFNCNKLANSPFDWACSLNVRCCEGTPLIVRLTRSTNIRHEDSRRSDTKRKTQKTIKQQEIIKGYLNSMPDSKIKLVFPVTNFCSRLEPRF